jgi:hypothetical protein
MRFLHVVCLLLTSPLRAFVSHKAFTRQYTVKKQTVDRPLSLQLSAQEAPEQILEGLVERLDGLNLQLSKTYHEGFDSLLSQVQSLATEKQSMPTEITHLSETYQEMFDSLLSRVQSLATEEQSVLTEITKVATKLSQELDQWLQQYPGAEKIYQLVLTQLDGLNLSTPVALLVSSVVSYLAVSTILTWGEAPPSSQPYPLQRYDPVAARAFFDSKLPQVIRRALEIATNSLGFGISLLKDKLEYVVDGKYTAFVK